VTAAERFALAALLTFAATSLGASCDPNPVDPSNTGGTGGYWPTPDTTGGAPATGGISGTGGASTGGTSTGGVGTGGAPPTEAERVCQHLGDIGCHEGDDPDCPRQIETIQALGSRASIDLSCLLDAGSVTEARACKSVACGGTL